MRLLTGNDLATGDVLWWTGTSWSRHVEEATDVPTGAEAIAAVEEGARRVTGAHAIDAAPGPDGAPRPAHIKDRIRARGPTVRPDLALAPADPSAGSWVI